MRGWTILALLVSGTLVAAPPPSPPQFMPITVADGLPSSVVYATVQDPRGFIWTGTQDGLARYDGIGFRVYRHDPSDPRSIASNDVSALLVDREGRLWCGGEASGLNRLEPDGSSFAHWMHRANDLGTLGSNDVFALAQDRAGAIWVGTYLGGLNRLEADGRFTHVDHDAEDPASLRSSTVFSLYGDDQNRLWIGTDRGLDVRTPDGRIVHVELPALEQRPGQSIVMSFLGEAGGDTLVGTRKGLFRVGADLALREEIMPQAPPLAVSALARSDAEGIWIGLLSGVARLDARGLHRYDSDEGVAGALPGARTMGVLSDREGGVWFSMLDGGLARLPPHWRNFASYRRVPGNEASLTGSRVSSIGIASDGAAWFTSGTDGLDRMDHATGAIERWGKRLGIHGERLTSVLPVGDDQVWVGLQTGLRVYMPRTRSSVELPVDLVREDALPPGFVNHLRRAPDGGVWASSRGGGVVRLGTDPPRVLHRYLPSAGTLGDTDISAMALDPTGAPWVATASGVERLDVRTNRFVDVVGLDDVVIDAFAFAPDGTLWTHRLGALERWRIDGDDALLMHRHDGKRGWETFGAHALTVDAVGDVWVTSPRGLWRLDARTEAVRRFDARDGLPSQEFIVGSLAVAGDGTVFAGTLGGVVAFDPALLRLESPPPPLHLTALQVRRAGAVEALDPAGPVTVAYDDMDFHVEMRALSYANPESNRYQVRLVGFDPDWVDAERGERTWPQLPAGHYTLEARAANVDGAWASLGRPLRVEVARAPWATPLAYALYATLAMLAVGLAFGAWRARVRRRHAYAIAEEQRRASDQLVEAKSSFLATLGHEIRTPMTGVLGMSELLLATPLDERQRAYAAAIQQSGQMLLRLVNDSLDIARIDAGKLALDDIQLDPAAVLREIAGMQQVLAQHKGLSISVEIGPEVPAQVWGDETRIKQILLNLVNNAIKFTERGGITLRLTRHGTSHLCFRVADTGPGMSAEVCARLFNRFEQAAGVMRRHGGSGLGLAICRELTLLMGGTISVSSTLDEGSIFDVVLPIYDVVGDAAAAPASKPADADALDILLVEDDSTVAEVVVGLLGQIGHRARHVANGLAALAELERARYDLVMLDLDLPGIDGLQLARVLRSGTHAALPLVAVTARSVGDEEARIRAAGMDTLLRKPVTTALMRNAIATALAARAPSA